MNISLLAKKIGMTQIQTELGVLPVTLLYVPVHDVFGLKTVKKHGYNAVIMSAGDVKKDKNISKPVLTQFKSNNLSPRQKLFEIKIDVSSDITSFERSESDFLEDIQGSFVDISGVTIGKGFSGPMKKWNFAGLEATHGVSVSHRSHGSTGQRQDPGRVFKGKKMAGHQGNVNRTVQNLKVVSVDAKLRVVAVYGAVPGSKNSYVFIRNSVKMGKAKVFKKVNDINLIF